MDEQFRSYWLAIPQEPGAARNAGAQVAGIMTSYSGSTSRSQLGEILDTLPRANISAKDWRQQIIDFLWGIQTGMQNGSQRNMEDWSAYSAYEQGVLVGRILHAKDRVALSRLLVLLDQHYERLPDGNPDTEAAIVLMEFQRGFLDVLAARIQPRLLGTQLTAGTSCI